MHNCMWQILSEAKTLRSCRASADDDDDFMYNFTCVYLYTSCAIK